MNRTPLPQARGVFRFVPQQTRACLCVQHARACVGRTDDVVVAEGTVVRFVVRGKGEGPVGRALARLLIEQRAELRGQETAAGLPAVLLEGSPLVSR